MTPQTGPYVYYVAQDGALWNWAQTGGRPAVPVSAPHLAPPGAQIATARINGGPPSVFFVGVNGAIYQTCPQISQPVPVTTTRVAPPGGQIAVAVTGSSITVVADGKSAFTAAAGPRRSAAGLEPLPMEISNPCSPPVRVMSNILTSYVPGGDFVALGSSDGGVGLYFLDLGGSLRTHWQYPTGATSDRQLTGAGLSAPGSGIAVSAGSATPLLVFGEHDGRVYAARAVSGGLVGSPVPNPTGAADLPDGAELSVAPQGTGFSAVYVSTTGVFTSTQLDVNGAWQSTTPLSQGGFAEPGAHVSVAQMPNGDEFELCPNPQWWLVWLWLHIHNPPPPPPPPWEVIDQLHGIQFGFIVT